MIALSALMSPAMAADVEKKLRLSFVVGGSDTDDAVSSASANTLLVTDRDQQPIQLFRDPRNDSAALGDLTIQPTTRATLAVQYALTKIFMLEGSVGYQKGDVGNVEVQGQFFGVRVPSQEDFNFSIFRVPAGEMEQVPIQVTALARFRPRASFNPYFGAGIGYIVVGFEPSDELNQLSLNMDQSVGGFSVLQAFFGVNALAPPVDVSDLDGARVSADDSFEWHLVGGAEISFKRKWALILDLRAIFASGEFKIGFNGSDSLGVSVPRGVVFADQIVGSSGAGAFTINQGGLIDGGRLAPSPGEDPSTDCAANPQQCEFVFEPDGVVDRGFYYAQGGSVEYSGISLQIGIRYTF